jgi:hypothetical protein
LDIIRCCQLYRTTSTDTLMRSDWLRRATASLKLVAAGLPLNKWTPNTLAKFAWCARRSTGEDPGVILQGEQSREEEEVDDADNEFENYLSRALINTDPETLDGPTASALLAYHARTDRVAQVRWWLEAREEAFWFFPTLAGKEQAGKEPECLFTCLKPGRIRVKPNPDNGCCRVFRDKQQSATHISNT